MGGTSAAFSGSEADNGGTTDDPDYRTVLGNPAVHTQRAGRRSLFPNVAGGHGCRPLSRHDKVTLVRPTALGMLKLFWGDAAMWNFRFAAHHVVSVFFCLICISGAHAQTAAEATGDKRVQVLEIRDPSAPGESLVNKPKAASKKRLRYESPTGK